MGYLYLFFTSDQQVEIIIIVIYSIKNKNTQDTEGAF